MTRFIQVVRQDADWSAFGPEDERPTFWLNLDLVVNFDVVPIEIADLNDGGKLNPAGLVVVLTDMNKRTYNSPITFTNETAALDWVLKSKDALTRTGHGGFKLNDAYVEVKHGPIAWYSKQASSSETFGEQLRPTWVGSHIDLSGDAVIPLYVLVRDDGVVAGPVTRAGLEKLYTAEPDLRTTAVVYSFIASHPKHQHWSEEVPDATGALQQRYEVNLTSPTEITSFVKSGDLRKVLAHVSKEDLVDIIERMAKASIDEDNGEGEEGQPAKV